MKKILSFILLLSLVACAKEHDVFPQDWVGHTFGNVVLYDTSPSEPKRFTESIEILTPTTAKITVRYLAEDPEKEQRLSAIYNATREKYLIKLTHKPKEPAIMLSYTGKPLEPYCLYLYPVTDNIFGLEYCYRRYKNLNWHLKIEKIKLAIANFQRRALPYDRSLVIAKGLKNSVYFPVCEIFKKDFEYDFPETGEDQWGWPITRDRWKDFILQAASVPVPQNIAGKALVYYPKQHAEKTADGRYRIVQGESEPLWIFGENKKVIDPDTQERRIYSVGKAIYIYSTQEVWADYYRLDGNLYCASAIHGCYLVSLVDWSVKDSSATPEDAAEEENKVME